MITLNELLNAMPHIQCSILTGFDRMNREIRTVTSIESPKSVEKRKGREIVLSSGVFFEGENIDGLYNFEQEQHKRAPTPWQFGVASLEPEICGDYPRWRSHYRQRL